MNFELLLESISRHLVFQGKMPRHYLSHYSCGNHFCALPFLPRHRWRSSLSSSSWTWEAKETKLFNEHSASRDRMLEYFRLNPGNWNRGNSGWIEWIFESLPFMPSGSKREKIDTVHIYRFDLSTRTLQANIKIYKNTE